MPRTPEFKREDVIEAATAVFWDRGYSQTSVADLVAATGLQPGSLYGAFGSKKGIYLEVLDAYHRAFMRRIAREQRHDAGALAGLISILEDMIDDAATGRDRRGCLAVNGLLEMSRHDTDIARRLAAQNARTRAALAGLVRTAQAQRDIDPGRDADEVAAFLLNNLWGLRVMCRSGADRDILTGVAAGILAGVRSRQGKARIRLSPAR